MKIYDITQELFGCAVYPGDPAPEKEVKMRIADGEVCNLTAFRMCAHNGTHVDAPYHFIDDGKTIDQVDMKRFIGYAYVVSHEGNITAKDAEDILKKANKASTDADCDCNLRILVKGDATMTEEAAKVFAAHNVHLVMLGAEIVLLEGIRLGGVEEGVYFLNAAPINLGGSDGAPCRAVLIRF